MKNRNILKGKSTLYALQDNFPQLELSNAEFRNLFESFRDDCIISHTLMEVNRAGYTYEPVKLTSKKTVMLHGDRKSIERERRVRKNGKRKIVVQTQRIQCYMLPINYSSEVDHLARYISTVLPKVDPESVSFNRDDIIIFVHDLSEEEGDDEGMYFRIDCRNDSHRRVNVQLRLLMSLNKSSAVEELDHETISVIQSTPQDKLEEAIRKVAALDPKKMNSMLKKFGFTPDMTEDDLESLLEDETLSNINVKKKRPTIPGKKGKVETKSTRIE